MPNQELMSLEEILAICEPFVSDEDITCANIEKLCATARAAHEYKARFEQDMKWFGKWSVLQEENNRLKEENEKLRAFKVYVHERLDKAGIPVDPEPENNKEHGCRIEGRLNLVLSDDHIAIMTQQAAIIEDLRRDLAESEKWQAHYREQARRCF